MTTPTPWQQATEIGVNRGISGLGMVRNPVLRAKIATEMARKLESALKQVTDQRQTAMAEALLQPGMSMAQLAAELGMSKSYVGKLAPLQVRQQVAERINGQRYHWTNMLRNWSPENTIGLGDERVLYLIASVSQAPGNSLGEWLVQVHDHKSGDGKELEREYHRTEAEARIAGVQLLLRRNGEGLLNGSSERRHYAHRGVNACGSAIDDRQAARTEPVSCLDCLMALGLLGAAVEMSDQRTA